MDDGRTQREHLEVVAKRGNAAVAATLAAFPVPALLARLWRDFLEVSHWRGSGGFGPALLSIETVEACERRILGRQLMPGELDLVKALDLAMLSEAAA